MNRIGRALLISRSLVRAKPIHSSAPLLHAKVPLSRPSTYIPSTYIPSITAKRAFHASRPTQVPLIPFAGVIAGLVKSSSIVNIISFTSKTSLTLLPYHLRKGKGASMLLALVMIPLAGSGLLVAIGLDMVR
jgi:hypothetical protein